MMTKNRPVFLDLTQIKFPLPAVMSVGHRASGILMVLLIPVLVYLLDLSLSGPEGFATAQSVFSGWFAKLVIFVLLWALVHHLLAGIRYLLIDFDRFVDKQGGRQSATAVMVAAPIIALFIELLL